MNYNEWMNKNLDFKYQCLDPREKRKWRAVSYMQDMQEFSAWYEEESARQISLRQEKQKVV